MAHLLFANVGLAGLVAGFLIRPLSDFGGQWVTVAGGTLYAVGALFWVYNLWRTFGEADARLRERAQQEHRQLRTLDE